MAEVHDCFNSTELVLMEDLTAATAWKEVLQAPSTSEGDLPVNPDSGPQVLRHPVGASGLHAHFEHWLQFRDEATPSARSPRVQDRKLGLVQNLGGYPARCSASPASSAPARLTPRRRRHSTEHRRLRSDPGPIWSAGRERFALVRRQDGPLDLDNRPAASSCSLA